MLDAPATTLSQWLRAATAQLERAGAASPRPEAERLAAHALGVSWGELWSHGELDASDSRCLREVLARRLGGEPLAYIAGSIVFYGLEIECGPGALVPRPETETLVDVALELIADAREPVVVDVGTGTGAVAIAISVKRPDAKVWATDISEDALEYARRNAMMWHANARIVRGDLLDALDEDVRGRVDLVVSNPPYVPDGSGLAQDIKAEPRVALFGGPLGTDVSKRLVSQAPRWLRPGGAVAFEIGESWQGDVLPGAEVREDHTGRARVVWKRF